MADVFLSYAREDRIKAGAIADALKAGGWTVWWDRKIAPGLGFEEAIERELMASRCVVVLWSRIAIGSNWVRNEAAEALERGVLVPVLIESVKIPIAFRHVHTADLVMWNGESASDEWQEILERITALTATDASKAELIQEPSVGSTSIVIEDSSAINDPAHDISLSHSADVTGPPASPVEESVSDERAPLQSVQKSHRPRRRAPRLATKSSVIVPEAAPAEDGDSPTRDPAMNRRRDLLPPPGVAAKIGFVSMLQESGALDGEAPDSSQVEVRDHGGMIGSGTLSGIAAILVSIWLIGLSTGETLNGLIHFPLIVAVALLIRVAVRTGRAED